MQHNHSFTYSEVYHAVPDIGTYNHAVMMDWYDGNFLLTWKIGAVNEDDPGQRILWSQSTDGVTWTPTDGTNEMFPNVSTSSNPAALFAGPTAILNGHRYATATPHQFCLFPDPFESVLLMRRVLPGIGNFGPVFWAAEEIPAGFEEASAALGIVTSSEMGADVAADLKSLHDLSTLPCSTEGTLKCEACLNGCDYDYPATQQLGGIGGSGEYTRYTVPNTEEEVILHRWKHQLSFTHRSSPSGNWSEQHTTEIPDAKSNVNAGALPDGRVYLVSNACSQGRDPLTLSVTQDGWTWDNSVGIMSCEGFGQCGSRNEGLHKDAGVAYPQAVTVTEPEEIAGLYVAATNNKEDVWVVKIPFDHLPPSPAMSVLL